MSVDTSKITGWSDSIRGNVTQITDASGRVIWSAFDGFVYLRPSADISVDSTLTLTPSDATAAYLLINEEVCDGEATTIGISQTVSRGSAVFSLDGNVPKNITRATDIYAVLSCYIDMTKYSSLTVYITVNDTTEYLFNRPYQNTSYDPQQVYVTYNNSAGTLATVDDMLAEINAYISANGVLPDIKLEFRIEVDSDDGAKSDDIIKVSQAYVVIECE